MKILLVDLNSLLYPIYATSTKEPDPDYTGKATVARIFSLANGYDSFAVCCDSPRSVRKELEPSYKANRPERDEVLLHQIKLTQEELRRFGVNVWQVDGYEADDLVCSAVTQIGGDIQGKRADIVIASSDKDLLQLVTDKISVYSFASSKFFGPAEVAEKFVRPELMRDYLVMVGDASDNVKGIPGIGHVRAKALLEACGPLKAIYERIAAGKVLEAPFSPSIVSALKDNMVTADIARRLVTLATDLPIGIGALLRPKDVAGELSPARPSAQDAGSPEPQKPALSMEPTVHDKETGEILDGAIEPEAKQEAKLSLVKVEWSRELEPRSLAQAERLANHMFLSRLFSAYGSREAVLSTILAGRELGVGAMASLRGFHIIEGKPSMSAGLMAALILQSGKARYFRCIKTTDEIATFKTHRVGEEEPMEISFKISDAERAGLIKEKSGWKKYPADMLVARVIARLARLVYPDVCFGLYTPEELGREDLELEAA